MAGRYPGSVIEARRLLAALAVAAVLAAIVLGGLGRAASGSSAGDQRASCHAQVTCVGQVANAPLGASALPAVAALAGFALLVLGRVDLRPDYGHGRQAAGRLFRPPRTAG
jgi:hypothetical protein